VRFTITEKPSNKIFAKLVDELPDRIEALIEHYPYWVANEFHKQLMRRGPRDIPGYLMKLRVRKFRVPKADHTFGVVLPSTAMGTKLGVDDAGDTVIYVTQKRETMPNEGVAVLEKYNPWTMDTLPYEPKAAKLVSRKVSNREVSTIRERRTDDADKVKSELANLGIKVSRAHATLLKSKVERDVVFEALRREFGAPGEPHEPHLRASLRAIQTNIEPRLFRTLARRYLSVPAERRWQKAVRAKKGKASFPKRVRPLQDFIIDGGD
jgi:hypothetical protein